MSSINLWECLTSLERDEDRPGRVSRESLVALEDSARWNGQEFSVEPAKEGWVLRVFSCYDVDGETGIEILIPKEGPVRILRDRDGRVEYHHD